MAAKIRLQRLGTRNSPFYHLVVAHKRKSATKQSIENLGHYDARSEPSKIVLKAERIQHWFGLGAELSNTARVLINSQKIKLERNKTTVASRATAKPEAKTATKATAKVAPKTATKK